MMHITLYTNTSERINLTKDITQLAALEGTLREETSMLDPVLVLTGIDSYLSTMNYLFIQEFGRYYFINSIKSVRNGLWEVSCHVDVLFTYKNSILEQSAIIARQENNFNLLLNDGMFRTTQKPRIATYNFPSGFTNFDYVIALAGD